MQYLIVVCVTVFLWKLIEVMPDIIAATHDKKKTDPYKDNHY